MTPPSARKMERLAKADFQPEVTLAARRERARFHFKMSLQDALLAVRLCFSGLNRGQVGQQSITFVRQISDAQQGAHARRKL